MQKSLSLIFSLSCCTLGNSILANSALAQDITADGTTNTIVNSNDNTNFNIDQGDRLGDNLFHSFGNFSVPTNGSASFQNEADIVNIFSRVTGGNISNIDGLIGANGGANLFLINPAGIVFGEGASLAIGGSFLGTTADSILFEDGEFSATDLDNPPLLTINAPIGLNFRDNPAPIENSSTASADFTDLNPDVTFDDNLFGLRVRDGKTFALAGGDIIADGGGIVAVGGRIELGAFGESGTVGINFEGDNISFNFPDDLARANVSLINNAGFLVSGSGGGDIAITANNIEILEGSGLFAGIFSGLGSPDAQAGDLGLEASGGVLIDGITENNNFSSIFNQVNQNSVGNAGKLNITATNLIVSNGAQVSTSTNGLGNGGDLFINTRESVLIDGASSNQNAFTGIFSQVNPSAQGNSGLLEINTGEISVINGSRIASSTFGDGNGGVVSINSVDSVFLNRGENDASTAAIVSNVEFNGSGNTQGVEINTDFLSVNGGAQIQSLVRGVGNSGQIMVNADSISFDGRNDADSPSGAFSSVLQSGRGDAGGIEIIANSLSITNRAQLLSNTSSLGNAGDVDLQIADEINLDNSIILSEISEEAGDGMGGDINLTTTSLQLRNGSALLADTENMGDAGDININASDSIIVSGEGISAAINATNTIPSQISATVESEAVGDGGDITIDTASLTVEDNGFISANTFGDGMAGDITINANQDLLLDNSFIVSEVDNDAVGNAGTIAILTKRLSLSNESLIGGRVFGEGEGGNINIQTNSIMLNNGGRIDAATQSETGEGANINLQVADNITLQNNSFISAQAFDNANGGNLTIDTNFIIAFPDGNNDIIANAQQGLGGVITISAESILGIEERALNDLTNDLNASSEDSTLNGNITINTSDINPIQGTTQLPMNPLAINRSVAQVCSYNQNQNTEIANSFVIKGKGGIPAAPSEPLSSESITIDGELVANLNNSYAIATSQGNIIPARGAVRTKDGRIILTANPSTANNSRLADGSINCLRG